MTASITKLMNAVLCTQLAEGGLLELDADASAYIGAGVRNPHFPEAPVSVRHLLTHTSGLVDDESAVNDEGRWKTRGKDCLVSLEEYVKERILGDAEKLWSEKDAPGAAYHYSNAGMTLCGFVIEKVSGRSLPSLAKERIFDVLGMARTAYGLAGVRALPEDSGVHRGGLAIIL